MNVLLALLLTTTGSVTPCFARPVLPPLVFVSRAPLGGAEPGDVPGIGPRWRAAAMGGRLLLRAAGGALATLIGPDRLFDVADPCVSWDGRRIVFAGAESRGGDWRIYEVGVDGAGFRQITRSDRAVALEQFGAASGLFLRYDDLDPCYLPDGRIVFASTRYPSLATLEPVRTTNLFVIRPDGTGMRRITTERNSGEEPSIDPATGRIVYARWWVNPDRPTNGTRSGLTRAAGEALTTDAGNVWQAVTVMPDGDELRLFAGYPRTREGVQAYKPQFMSDGRMVATYTTHLPALPSLGGTAVRLFRPGPAAPRTIVGSLDGTPPFALEASELDAHTVVLCYSPDGVEYGIWTCRLDGSRLRRLVDLPGTLEMDPQPVRVRSVPPVLADSYRHEPFPLPPTEDPETHARDDFFRFDCMNIFANAGVDVPIPDAPRITRNARIRFFMNVQRQNPHAADPSILLKEAPVMYHGGVHEHDVPAEVPLFEQVVDSAGRVLETADGRPAHVAGFNFERQGAGTKCVGCHIGHSMMEVPINGSHAEWFNLAPSATVTGSPQQGPAGGRAYGPSRLVDRQARTGGDAVVWITRGASGATALLRWPMPVEVREVVLYGIPRNISGHAITVDDCRIMLYSGGESVRTVSSTGRVRSSGTRVRFPQIIVDSMKVEIRKTRVQQGGGAVTGLAEVEVIGRIPRPDVR